MDRIWGQMLKLGGSLDPHACFLLERSLKTLALRMKKHNANAMELATWLENNERVEKVYYPGLSSYPQYNSAKELLHNGNSGMISFEIKGGDEAAIQFVKNVHLPKEATSLGGLESLVSLPFNTSQASLTKAQRREIGINDGLIRLSVGLEEINDIIKDIDQAF